MNEFTGWLRGYLEDKETLTKEEVEIIKTELIQHNEQFFYAGPTLNLPTCDHEYPNPWHSTVPPACIKCGEQNNFGVWPIYSISTINLT